MKNKDIIKGLLLGITFSLITIFLLTTNIQQLKGQTSQQQKYTVFKTENEGFRFYKTSRGRTPSSIQLNNPLVELAPIFAQTPTESSAPSQVATKAYVDSKIISAYPFWVLVTYNNQNYYAPLIKAPELKWTDWYTFTVRQQANEGISSYRMLQTTAQNIPVINQILNKQITKIEVRAENDAQGSCLFQVRDKIGIIWISGPSLYRNPTRLVVSYNLLRNSVMDINLGGWYSRKDLMAGSITSYNRENVQVGPTYTVDIFNSGRNVTYAFCTAYLNTNRIIPRGTEGCGNDNGIYESFGFIKNIPSNNYLVINPDDILMFEALVVKRGGNQYANCKIRFQYYDSYVPSNVINPVQPLTIP